MSGGTDVDQPVRSGISAVIVTFRTGDVLLECVDSVLAAPDVDELVLVNHDNPADMVDKLEQRIESDGVRELVIATNPTMAGEATALYLADLVRGRARVTRLASGLPVGADLEHAVLSG